MKFPTRLAAIAAARKTTPRYRVPFPDLSVPSPYPLSNTIAIPGANTPKRTQTCDLSPEFVIDTTHKQGPAVHSIRESQYLGGRKV